MKKILSNGLIHAFHFSWAAALLMSMDADGSIRTYTIFLPLLVVALMLEMLRWHLIGSRTIVINGPYTAAVEIESINRESLSHSWYVFSPSPPFKLIEVFASRKSDWNRVKTASHLFSIFWLRSEMAAVLLGALVLSYVFFNSSPPFFYGMKVSFAIKYLFWFFEFGLFGKIIAICFYCFFIELITRRK